ncbi:acyl-CoA dehydrogenase family protein [Amycolatopsis rhabdoformis]|uniref:Acyl-CoA dehydrogenase family protein n=1 Tax=Amycolatopsis rhabdoformis TaxID=1448059 RepID=A0ABZ1I2M9_9PSEU|nr:acyl-CoA dehydrogenase family protein [Amycolatopsis rhabdoformis]WSE28634.1 acyl-CoA dehydrogenase family protein [Amycolatopsis rhabdoformis]
MPNLVARARALADDVLFPAAAEVDLTGEVPRSHFDVLAEAGLYGLVAPTSAGGSGAGLPELVAVIETLAGGCLSTTFTWIQHHGLVAALAGSSNAALRTEYLADLVKGTVRAAVAYGGALPTPPRTRAVRVPGGFRFSGDAPFVSGWGTTDVLMLSGQTPEDTVVSTVVAPAAAPGLTATPLQLVAAQATATVRLDFDDFFVPAERVLSETPHADFVTGRTFAVRLSGCAPLGVAERCARLLSDLGHPATAAALRAEQAQIRIRLDSGLTDPPSLPAARAAAAELCYRSAGALVAAAGSRAVLAGEHAGRLVREATFLLVAASRPEIRDGLLSLARR